MYFFHFFFIILLILIESPLPSNNLRSITTNPAFSSLHSDLQLITSAISQWNNSTSAMEVNQVLPSLNGIFKQDETYKIMPKMIAYADKICWFAKSHARAFRREDLYPHWWLDPLGDKQPVEPWARVQPPVRTRRRGQHQNPRREPSAFEVAQAQAAAGAQDQANIEGQ